MHSDSGWVEVVDGMGSRFARTDCVDDDGESAGQSFSRRRGPGCIGIEPPRAPDGMHGVGEGDVASRRDPGR